MVVARGWHRPSRAMAVLLMSAGMRLFIAVGLAIVPLPIPGVDVAVAETARWGLVTLAFLLSLLPLVPFLFLASVSSRYRTVEMLEGLAWTDRSGSDPPFKPGSEKRYLRWRWYRTQLPSCRIWVFRRPRRDAERVAVLLASTDDEASVAVSATRKRIRRWLDQFPRPN